MNKEIVLNDIDENLFENIKSEAETYNLDIKTFLKGFLKKTFGNASSLKTQDSYHDLDNLAGAWNEDDIAIFNENIKYFSEIDKELW
ncbi:MAG: hypothetical protein K8R54_07750 [Bacteroidales bacterium]|nr:hypothetical protein [Bacteroidales bacterium]